MNKKIALILLLVSSFNMAQIVEEKSTNPKTNYTKFDIHLAYGIFAGVRLGFRYYPIHELSLETSYGLNYGVFLGTADDIRIYNIGINLQPTLNSFPTYSLNLAYYDWSDLESKGQIRISPSIGFMNIKKEGLTFFIRGGFSVGIYDFETNKFDNIGFGLNLDLGINFNIFTK